jgi:hypothetical protein
MTMRATRRILPFLFAAALALAGPRAHAGSPEAEALFQDGLRHMDAKDYAAACPLFEKSQALEPSVGSLYQLGDCYLSLGRTASAWGSFRAAADAAAAQKDDVRAKAARSRAEALSDRLVHVLVVVAQEAPGLVVTIRDQPVPPSSWGSPLPVDPGTFSVRATAPRKRAFEIPLTLRGEGTTQKVTIPLLQDEAEDAPPPTSPAPPAASQPGPQQAGVAPPAVDIPTAKANGWQRPLALVVGGLGVVGLGVGSYFGLRSLSKHDDAATHCGASTCDAQGYDANKDALSSGTTSTVAFLVGGGLLATGIVLWVTTPTAPRAAALRVVPAVGPRFAGLGASGAF